MTLTQIVEESLLVSGRVFRNPDMWNGECVRITDDGRLQIVTESRGCRTVYSTYVARVTDLIRSDWSFIAK